MSTSTPIPSFHDGYLVGITLAEKQAILTLKRLNGRTYELLLSSVDSLRMEDFREGNIIMDLEVIQGELPHVDTLERLFPPPHASVAVQYHDTHDKLLTSKAAAVGSGQAVVVIITPSYGADLIALCASVTLTDVTTTDC